MLTDPTVTSITVDPPLSPHELQSVSRTPHRELPTSNATPTRPHTAFADTRHTYAQRHADAGIPIDVLAELLDHRSYSVTRRYYRIGEDPAAATPSTRSPRSASTGTATGSGATPTPDGLRARPPRHRRGRRPLRHLHRTNQRQGRRRRLPVRFRCAGCDHFRTNIAFLPDLQAYLDDLLRTRERLAATIDGSTTGPAPTPPPPRRRSPGSAG